MSILWCGGEECDFETYPNYTTTSTYFRSTFARQAFQLYYASNFYKSSPFPGGAAKVLWLSCQAYYQSAFTSHWSGWSIGVTDGNHKGIWLNTTGYNSTMAYRIHKYDGTTQTNLITGANNTTPLNALHRIDISIDFTTPASCPIKVYTYGVNKIMDDTKDASITGVTEFSYIELNSGLVGGGGYYVSEIIVADEDTRPMSLKTHAPDSAGDANGWSGAYADINEQPCSDLSCACVNSNDADMQVGLANTPTGSFRVRAVALSARACASSGATPTGLALGVKHSGSFDYGSKQSLTTLWAPYIRIMPQNPVDSADWVTGDVDTLQMNLRSKS